jgi:hypothetical protein
MSAIPKGEIRTKGKRAFISTTWVYTAQKQFSDNWSSQGLIGRSTYHMAQSRRRVVSFRSMTEQLKGRNFAEEEEPSSVLSKLLSGFRLT